MLVPRQNCKPTRKRFSSPIEGDDVNGKIKPPSLDSPQGLGHPHCNSKTVQWLARPPIWFLQGINVLPGSFMSGQMRWAVRGGILVFAGIAGLVWANRKRQCAG
jgi:hypothetical protein